jgi:ABC-type multidrug transport system fused ATPase/permease subunit
MDTSLTIAEEAPRLSRSPWRFVLYFYLKARRRLLAIFVFEAAQAACTILLPYAVKEIIDAVTLANETGVDIFAASKDGMILFAALNLGIVIFSRASGAMLVLTGPHLRREIRKSLFSYLQHHSHRYFISHFAGSLASRIAEVSMSCMHTLWTITFDFYPLIIKSVVALIILMNASSELALTLSIDAQEILVDPGVYVYTASQEYRNLFRSVFSHNTVAIASQEQNRFLDESPWWGCHEDTRCKCLTWHDSPEQAVFVGEHKGYLRLESPVLHRRRIEWKKHNRKLTITDEMVSQKSAELGPSMLWTFMLHPDCHIQSTDEQVAIVEREGIRLEFRASQGQWQVSTGLYSPSYGVKQICPKLVLDFPAGVAGNTVHITW